MTVPQQRSEPAQHPLDPADVLAVLDQPGAVVVQREAGWHARLDLPVVPTACASARRTVKVLLRAWQAPTGEPLHDALVVVSELVGNVVRHGGSRYVLELDLDGDRLVVGVRDDAVGRPLAGGRDEQAESGRGLGIVAALSEEWGCDELGDGTKRVWARMVLHG